MRTITNITEGIITSDQISSDVTNKCSNLDAFAGRGDPGGIKRVDRSAPMYVIDIEGLGKFTNYSGPTVRLLEVNLPHDHKIPIVRISIVQPFLEWVNDPIFDEWRKLEIYMGYPSTGIVQIGGAFYTQMPKLNVLADGTQTMDLVCFGEQILLGATEKLRSWGAPNVPLYAEAVVAAIAQEYNLLTDIEPTNFPIRQLQIQAGISDWDLLEELAQKFNYMLYIDGGGIGKKGVLHFHSVRFDPIKFRFILAEGALSNLGEFVVGSNVFMRGLRVKIADIDYENPRMPFIAESDIQTKDILSLANPTISDAEYTSTAARLPVVRDVPTRYMHTLGAGPHTLPDAQIYVQSLSDASKWYVTASGLTIGLETLRPRQLVEIVNVGRHSGEYYVTNVIHRFENGQYSTEFQLARTWREKANISNLTSQYPGEIKQESIAMIEG